MGVVYNSKIVTDGLVLCLDAGNRKSYPGTGTAWTDLSGNGRTGTINGGVGYSGLNGGSLTFDGTDDKVNLSSGFSITNNFTVELWCLPEGTHQIDTQATSGTTGTYGQNYILGVKFVESPDAGFGISIGTNGVSTYEHSNSYMPPLLVHETTITSFTNIVVVYNNKQPSLYINGTFIKTGLTSPRPNVYLIGDFIAFGDYSYYQGKLASIRYYERAITAAEIQQNYLATKSRYFS